MTEGGKRGAIVVGVGHGASEGRCQVALAREVRGREWVTAYDE